MKIETNGEYGLIMIIGGQSLTVNKEDWASLSTEGKKEAVFKLLSMLE